MEPQYDEELINSVPESVRIAARRILADAQAMLNERERERKIGTPKRTDGKWSHKINPHSILLWKRDSAKRGKLTVSPCPTCHTKPRQSGTVCHTI